MKTNQTTRTKQQLVLQTQPQIELQLEELATVLRLVLHDPLEITPDMQERAEQPELENYWIARLPDRKTTRNRVGPEGGGINADARGDPLMEGHLRQEKTTEEW